MSSEDIAPNLRGIMPQIISGLAQMVTPIETMTDTILSHELDQPDAPPTLTTWEREAVGTIIAALDHLTDTLKTLCVQGDLPLGRLVTQVNPESPLANGQPGTPKA